MKSASPNPPTRRSIVLPLQFLLTGIVTLLLGVLLLTLNPDVLATYHYNQHVIALTHLFNLGWITSVIMGATYQLVPVALETKLYSERLARWQFAVHLIGFAGMVWMFWVWDMKLVGVFGTVFGVGVILFVCNLGLTLARAPRRSVTWLGIVSALTWLSLTVSAGLYLAAAKCWDIGRFDAIARMHAHAHLGVVGFFLTMIVGVSYKLIPMFALAEIRSEARARWSLRLINGGLAALFCAILTQSRCKPICALVVAAGLALYGMEMRASLRARKRGALDWGIRYFLTALSLLIPLSLLGLVLSWPSLKLNVSTGQWENVYGFLAIMGVVTLALLGMLYKILPFLIWFGRYSSEIGRNKTPALSELYSAGLQRWGYWSFLAGLAVTTLSTPLATRRGVQAGCAVLTVSCLLFAANVACMLSHLFRANPARPQVQPLLSTAKPYANLTN